MPAQRESIRSAIRAGTALFVGFGLLQSSGVAHAALSQSEYLEALKIADQFVQRRKTIAGGANALSSTVLRSLFGRYYQVGDTWDVAAYHSSSNIMRMSALPEGSGEGTGKLGIFRYEVIEVKGGTEPEVLVKVTQLDQNGVKPVDAQVESITLKMNDRLQQSEKTFLLRNGTAMGGGLSAPRTTLALFPLDVPDVVTAERARASNLPELPGRLQALAQQVGFKPEIARSSWFEQSDFFGRPVQVLWQQGDPWPSYIKTANGVAILLRKGQQ